MAEDDWEECYGPGYNRGPGRDGSPGTFLCELPKDHDGDHAWSVDRAYPEVTWPVGVE